MIELWQNIQYSFNPVLFQIAGFNIKYYNLLIIFGFLLNYIVIRKRSKNVHTPISIIDVDKFFIFFLIGMIAGARIGYHLFYGFSFAINKGITGGFHPFIGLSYHGGMLGIFIATLIYCKLYKINFFQLSDLVISVAPLGYTFGRIGNFFNGELYGRITSLPIGIYFKRDPTHSLRHPSQLYEAFAEGVLLFILLSLIKDRKECKNMMLGFYLIGYGFFRFIIEFVREPDHHMGLILLSLTMGQFLCIVMIIIGLFYISPFVQRFAPKEAA